MNVPDKLKLRQFKFLAASDHILRKYLLLKFLHCLPLFNFSKFALKDVKSHSKSCFFNQTRQQDGNGGRKTWAYEAAQLSRSLKRSNNTTTKWFVKSSKPFYWKLKKAKGNQIFQESLHPTIATSFAARNSYSLRVKRLLQKWFYSNAQRVCKWTVRNLTFTSKLVERFTRQNNTTTNFSGTPVKYGFSTSAYTTLETRS